MNQELLTNVLSAIEALITDEAAHGHPAMKYRNISKLCEHAMGIRRLGVTRVKDAGALIEEGGIGFGDNPIIANEPDPPTIIRDDTEPDARYFDIGRMPQMGRMPQIRAHVAHVAPHALGNDLTQAADLIRTFSDQVAAITSRANDPIGQLDKLAAIRDSLASRDVPPHDQIVALDRQIAVTITALNPETAHAPD